MLKPLVCVFCHRCPMERIHIHNTFMKIRKFNTNTLQYHTFINIHSNFFHRSFFSSKPNPTPGSHTEVCCHLSLGSVGPDESVLQPFPNLLDKGSLDEYRQTQACSRLLSLCSLAIAHARPCTSNCPAFYLPSFPQLPEWTISERRPLCGLFPPQVLH